MREIRSAADRFVVALDDLDSNAALQTTPHLSLARQMDQIEKVLIKPALRRTQDEVSAATELPDTRRMRLYDKLNRHGILIDNFR